MTVNELASTEQFEILSLSDGERQIRGAYCGDLLSWVMGRAEEDNAFVTIMTNINVVAVASLINVSVVILTENAELNDDVINAAGDKGVNILRTPLSSYEACVKLSQLI